MSRSKSKQLPTTSVKQKKPSNKQQSSWLSRAETLHPGIVLCIVFVCAVVIRHVLNLMTTNGPIVYIDEGLYVNLARGLAFDHELTYRAMPTSYVYLTYPFVLVPLMLILPATANLYRAVQLYNALLMTTAIFPTYLLARRMELDKRQSYLAVLFILVMPDMSLSGCLMSECLLYPLFMWLAYFGYRAFEQNTPPICFIFACSLLTSLLYFTKPGYVIFGTVMLVLLLFGTLHRKNMRGSFISLLALVLLAALIAGGYAIYRATLDSGATLLTHYDKQIPTLSLTNIFVAIQATILHLITFLISGLGVLLLFPLFGQKHYTTEKKQLLFSTLISLLVNVIGIAVMVSLYEWQNTWLKDRQHLRYIMCYAPILFLLLLSADLDTLRLSTKLKYALFVTALLTVFPGGYSAFTDASAISDSAALAVFYVKKAGWISCILISACVVCFILWLISALKKRGFSSSVRKTVTCALLVFLLTNSFTTYSIRSATKIRGSIDIEPEAQALAELIADEQPLMVTTNLYDDFRGYQSDVHLHRPVQYVVSNNLLLDAIDTQGIYRPFVPLTQSPNTYNTETVDTDLLILDLTVADYLEFTDSVSVSTTPNGLYSLARIQKGQPYLKTAISGMYGYTLRKGSTGSLIVYESELLDRGSLKLHIMMHSTTTTDDVTFRTSGQSISIPITSEPTWYEINLPVTACDFWNISFSSQNDLIILKYYTTY